MADNEWNKIEDEFKNLGALNSPEVKGTTIFFFFANHFGSSERKWMKDSFTVMYGIFEPEQSATVRVNI